jgi:hypothetical protein
LVIHQAPDAVRRFNEIRAIDVPGFDRSGELQRFVINTFVELVTLPALIVAALGYGIMLQSRGDPQTGGRFFQIFWTSGETGGTKPRRRNQSEEGR